MDQNEIFKILDKHIFDREKAYLLETITNYPDRFVGRFRSTNPYLKLLQNLLQSREIRFGDALEEVIEKILEENGFVLLNKKFDLVENEKLTGDQYFTSKDGSKSFLIEQKVRDDHDSSKKRGQIENFRKKLTHLTSLHGTSLVGIMYFIDPSFHKNRKYYLGEISDIKKNLNIEVYLFYNGDLFNYLHNSKKSWDFLQTTLDQWRLKLDNTISLNYDADFQAKPNQTLEELKSLNDRVWSKLISTTALWENKIVQELFPEGTALDMMYKSFEARSVIEGKKLQTLTTNFRVKLNQYYPLLKF